MSKTLVMVLGVIVVIVGLLGFVSSPVLGIFASNSLLNIVWIVFGIILIWASKSGMKSMTSAEKWIGIIYLIMAILGFISGTSVVGLFMVNSATNWLHLVLALIFLYGGFMSAGGSSMNAPMAGQM